MKKDELHIYTPTIEQQKPLEIPEVMVPDDEKQYLDEHGDIPVEMDQKVIIQRISKELYKSEISGVRELLSNAFRHCREARRLYGSNSRVEITYTPSTRELIIHDIDAMGMSKHLFYEIFRKLGKSSNENPNESGMFGMGFAAYLRITSAIQIESKARTTDEHYRTIGRDGLSFTALNDVMPDDDTAIKEYGLKLKLILYKEYEGEKLEDQKIIDYLESICRFAEVPVIFNLTESTKYTSEHKFPLGSIRRMGTYKLAPVTVEQYFDQCFQKQNYDVSKIYSEKIDYEDDEIEFHAIMAVSDKGSFIKLQQPNRLHIIGIPIDGDISLPEFTGWVINIKNERTKYKPVPSRDNLTTTSEININRLLDDILSKFFLKHQATTLEEFKQLEYKIPMVYMDTMEISNHFGPKLISEKTRDVHEFFRTNYLSYTIDTIGPNRAEHLATHEASLSEYMNKTDKIIWMSQKSLVAIKSLKLVDPDYIFINVKNSVKDSWDVKKKRLIDFNIPKYTEVIKLHKLKLSKERASLSDVVVHTNHGRYETIHEDPVDIGDDVIKCGDNFKDVISILRHNICSFGFIKDYASLPAECEALTLDQFLADAKLLEFETNKGRFTYDTLKKYINDNKENMEPYERYLNLVPLSDVKNSDQSITILKDSKRLFSILSRDDIFRLILISNLQNDNIVSVAPNGRNTIQHEIMRKLDLPWDDIVNYLSVPELEMLYTMTSGMTHRIHKGIIVMITDRLIYSYYDDKKKLWIPPVIEKLVSLESQAPSATFEEPLNVYKYGAWLLSDGVLNELYSVIPEHDSLNHESIKYDIRESRTTIYDRFIIEKVKYTIKNEQIPKVIIELNVRPLFPDAVKITGRFIPYKSLSGYDYYPERVAINVIIPKEKFKSFKVSEKLADLLGANLYNISNIKWFVYNSVSLTKQHVVITLGFSHDRDLSGW